MTEHWFLELFRFVRRMPDLVAAMRIGWGVGGDLWGSTDRQTDQTDHTNPRTRYNIPAQGKYGKPYSAVVPE